MIELLPVAALVAAKGRSADVVSPPYDAFGVDGRLRYANEHPDSFLNVILSPADLDAADPVEVATRARAYFEAMLDRGLYEDHGGEGFYLYELDTGNHRQLGVIAGISNRHIRLSQVLGHEATMTARTNELAEFYRTARISSSAVSMTYQDDGRLAELLESYATATEPIREFVSEDGVAQRLWLVNDRLSVEAIVSAGRDLDRLYITDGHHRVSAADIDGVTPGWFLGVLFPTEQLHVLEYNRFVCLDHPVDEKRLFDELATEWEVSQLGAAGEVDPRPLMTGEISMLVNGVWSRLMARAVPTDPRDGLDVAMLHDRIIGPLFGISNYSDPRLAFVVGVNAVDRLETRCSSDRHVGFALHPTELDQLMRIADAGETMPAKSTYFMPKARSGLVVVRW